MRRDIVMTNPKPPVKGEVTSDAASLPPGWTGIKHNSPQPKGDGVIETVALTVQQGPYQRTLVSHLKMPNGREFASIRVFASDDGVTFKPPPKGVVMQTGLIDRIVDGLRQGSGSWGLQMTVAPAPTEFDIDIPAAAFAAR